MAESKRSTPPDGGGGLSVEEEAPPPESMASKRVRAKRRRFFRRFVKRMLQIGVLIAVITVAGLSQTGEGQELVLDAALDRIRSALSGELLVGGIRSGTLLTGATLTQIRLTAADGRRFMAADSVVVRYSLPSLLFGSSPIRSTTFWGVDVEISRFTADDVLNVTRLLAESEPDSTSTGPGRPIELGRIGLRHGTVRLLTPARPGTTAPTVVAPDGARLQQLVFGDVDLDLEGTVLQPGASVELEARLASFSGSVYVTEEPLVLREVFGEVTYGARGIRIRDAAFRLPSSLLRGDFTVGPPRPGADWTVSTRVTSDGWGDLRDIAWVDPRIPRGRFRGTADIRVPGAVEIDFDDFEVELEASDVVVDGWVSFGEVMTLRSMQVTSSPLVVERLEPWVGIDFPFDGWLSGQATFSGTLMDLGATGRVTLVPTGYGGVPTIADFSGTVHRGEDPGATDLDVRLTTANYSILESLWPAAPVAGTGSGRIRIDGRADSGMTISTEVTHITPAGATSRGRAQGTARRLDDGEWVTDLRGELYPLALDAFAASAPELGLQGSVSGPVTANGRIDDLHVTGELESGEGRVTLDATVDLRRPAAGYHVDADADALPLSALVAELPDRSSWTGRLTLDGRGFVLDSMESRATLVAARSRVGHVQVDTVAAAFRISRGVLIADTLDARIAGVDLEGRGRFGLAPGTWGSSRVSFETESLVGLRPLLMGVSDTVLIRDDLGELQRSYLRATGVDPDTLPSALDVRMEGVARGALSLSGEVRSFDLGVIVNVADGAYQHNEVDSARVALTATELPGVGGTWGFGMTARGIVWEGRSFEQGGFEAEMTERRGTGRIELVRSDVEAYAANGSFEVRDDGGSVSLENAQVQVGEDLWALMRPVDVGWDERSVRVDSLRIQRDGPDPMELTAGGTLARGGASDFRAHLEGLHVERVVHVGQLGLDVGGHIDLDVEVTGSAESPSIEGSFRIDGPKYGAMQLTRLEGTLEYADQVAAFTVQGWDGGRDAIDASGRVAFDLSLTDVDERLLERPMDVRISADSLDAAIALSYLTTLEQVVGTVSGTVHVGGTPSAPEPEGQLTLSDAEWTIDAIGVRHSQVDGTLTLNPDRTADVALTSTGVGYSDVHGTVYLDPFSDPRLDLTFSFDRFQAVERLDVEGLITGEFVLGGRYRRPVAQGSLTVNEGTVYVDEFQRVAGVVDLTDPLLFERGLGVDTTALVSQPLLTGLRNPFFDNLRVDIDLAVPRDTWLRSIETNVEIAGDLQVVWDRSQSDLVLIGELQAVRGSHLVLGRTFEVDGGSVVFIGRPGLNPDLSIDASSRILRHSDDDLEVSAHVGGTLIQPLVTLSTEEAAISEADIVSYLIFGQASGELGRGQSTLFRGLPENAAISTAGTVGLTYASGALANQFGAVLAQTGLLDYVSVQVLGTEGNQIAGRYHLEAGRYLGRDVFVVLVFRPSPDPDNSNPFGGARVEWEPVDEYHVEAFIEDRYLRSGAAGLALPSLLQDQRILGVFVFKEWGL